MSSKERLRKIESDYGRNFGWFVEVDGRKIARLSDPQQTEMFWVSYRLEPITDDGHDLSLLYSSEFWNSCRAEYRNCEFNEIAPYAFAGGIHRENRLLEEKRIEMRGLYLVVPRYLLDIPVFWFIRLMRFFRRSLVHE